MVKPSGILTGTAGVYYVASQLAMRNLHAAVTYGNAPSVDILVGQVDGSATLSLQVKTSWSALRMRGRGEKKIPHHYEWVVSEKSAKLQRRDLIFAFVDLQKGQKSPDVFIVPSNFLFNAFNTPYWKSEKHSSYWGWFPKVEKIEQYKNNWRILEGCLNEGSRSSGT